MRMHAIIDGETKTVAEWSRISGINLSTILLRLNAGWKAKDAVFTPPRQFLPYELTKNGIEQALDELPVDKFPDMLKDVLVKFKGKHPGRWIRYSHRALFDKYYEETYGHEIRKYQHA